MLPLKRVFFINVLLTGFFRLFIYLVWILSHEGNMVDFNLLCFKVFRKAMF